MDSNEPWTYLAIYMTRGPLFILGVLHFPAAWRGSAWAPALNQPEVLQAPGVPAKSCLPSHKCGTALPSQPQKKKTSPSSPHTCDRGRSFRLLNTQGFPWLARQVKGALQLLSFLLLLLLCYYGNCHYICEYLMKRTSSWLSIGVSNILQASPQRCYPQPHDFHQLLFTQPQKSKGLSVQMF